MQNTEEPDLSAPMLGVGSNLQQSGRTGFEKQLEENLLVLPNERDQRVWDAENQVVVIHGQQLLLPSGQPLVPSVCLALRAMTIPARIIREALMTAAIALVSVSTQCRGAASFDRVEHLYLWPGEALPKAKHETPARLADDISHLPGWPLHD